MRTLNERRDVVPVAEVFREFGYECASLSLITEKTGLGALVLVRATKDESLFIRTKPD